MSITVEALIEKLKEKDPKAEVEFIVAKTTGELVCAHVKAQASNMAKMLKMFR